MARAHNPVYVIAAVRVGRMTAFCKRTGGVRGNVAGDALRRLIARTIAQQMSEAVQAATATVSGTPYRRGVCCARTSIDGVSAHDSISLRAMLEELEKVHRQSTRVSRMDPEPFRVLLLRRLRVFFGD